MCISVSPIKDYAAIFPANCLGCYQAIISGWQKTKPNEANPVSSPTSPGQVLSYGENEYKLFEIKRL
jgi:hypothetical protein